MAKLHVVLYKPSLLSSASPKPTNQNFANESNSSLSIGVFPPPQEDLYAVSPSTHPFESEFLQDFLGMVGKAWG